MVSKEDILIEAANVLQKTLKSLQLVCKREDNPHYNEASRLLESHLHSDALQFVEQEVSHESNPKENSCI